MYLDFSSCVVTSEMVLFMRIVFVLLTMMNNMSLFGCLLIYSY